MFTTCGTGLPLATRTIAKGIVAKYITWSPEIDVFERDNRFVARVDLPGMKRAEVKVAMNDGRLVIAGERKTHADGKRERYYRCEREYGHFHRVIPLPAGVLPDAITTTFADGVLEVSMALAVARRAKGTGINEGATAPQPVAA
jgi:HSP20 family protein